MFVSLVAACSQGATTSSRASVVLTAGGTRAAVVLPEFPALVGTAEAPLTSVDLAGDDAETLTLTLLVACALPGDGELDVALPGGGVLQFFGEVGVAPGWMSGSLDARQRQLVSGCVLAHLSLDGLPAVVSLRGSGISAGPDEASLTTLDEGAFFGDLFACGQTVAACLGTGPASDPAAFAQRSCAQPDPSNPGYTLCGLRFAGTCASACDYRRSRCDLMGEAFRPVTSLVVTE